MLSRLALEVRVDGEDETSGTGMYRYTCAGCVLVGLDGCEVRLCDPCALVRPRVPCVSCVSRLPPVSFYFWTHSWTHLPRSSTADYTTKHDQWMKQIQMCDKTPGRSSLPAQAPAIGQRIVFVAEEKGTNQAGQMIVTIWWMERRLPGEQELTVPSL